MIIIEEDVEGNNMEIENKVFEVLGKDVEIEDKILEVLDLNDVNFVNWGVKFVEFFFEKIIKIIDCVVDVGVEIDDIIIEKLVKYVVILDNWEME